MTKAQGWMNNGGTSPNENEEISLEKAKDEIDEKYEPGYHDDDYCSSDDDEIQYCDCVAAALQKSLPGTPGRRGIIPYIAVYDSQAEARQRGYWIPGVPVNAKITHVERNTDPGIHIMNTFLYTIELEHGKFKWTVVRNYSDFAALNNRLFAHRAAERIRAPVRRVQERLDTYLESWGIDVIEDHKDDCPYSRKNRTESRRHKMEVLKRTADALESTNDRKAPLASTENSTTVTPEDETRRRSLVMAVQSGILEEDCEVQPTPIQTPNSPAATTVKFRPAPSSDSDGNIEIGECQGSVKKRKTRIRKKHTLPHFPRLPESMADMNRRKEELEEWLQMLLHIPINRNHHETAEFLEISRFSFVNDLGGKHTEGFVKKRPGGNRVFIGWKQCCVRYFVPWSKRWLMVRDSFVAYMDPDTEQIRLVLLMDKDFKVAAGGREADGMPNGLIITNTQHILYLKCRRVQDTSRWKAIIEQSMAGIGNIWTQAHRFSSSFPIRENCYGKWFVDSREYMSEAADMMELAREEIFIADWWLSPEIYMKRPALQGTYWRLDEILKRKASQGVRIFILIYKEMEMALGLNSLYTKKTLQALHPNIRVMRHPDHYPGSGTYFWAHHEKLVIVDQLIAFVGGVDLCFGRWDDEHHVLTDLGSVQFNAQHVMNTDTSFATGLRALVKAPLTLSPLGLEEDEKVVPREPQAVNLVTGHVGAVEPSPSAAPCNLPPVAEETEGVDETDRSAKDTTAIIESTRLEAIYSDKETGGVRASVWTKVRKPATISAIRHSSPPDVSSSSTLKADTAQKSKSLVRIVDDAQGKKHILRSFSSSPSRLPKGVLDNAAPPVSIMSTAVEKGMDIASVAEMYKEYVESGAAAKEKLRSQTPPMKRKENRLSRAVVNWRSNRAKRKWKQVLDSDEVTAGYELEWLRIQAAHEKTAGDDLDGGVKLWIGKDYVNYIAKDFIDVDLPFNDFIDRGATPRMPWHDIHSVTFGAAARDVARHFIQRWNATKTEKLKSDPTYPYLLPKSYENLKVPRVFRNPAFSENVNVQVLRSLSNWSGSCKETEDSIQMAYLSLIANSKHYIYIENQFFVSMIDSPDVLNEICKVLCNRIIRAHKEKTKFRVYIMLPLLPGFEGDVGAPGGSALQAVLYWTYRSLSQGPNCLLERLKQVIPDPSQYLFIGSLRTHDTLCGKLVSELIYIHCKLMIVDDESVIIGSANINDRSQFGNRDSEVCLLFTDIHKERSLMDGKVFEAGRFAKSIRLRCMKEHLGLLPGCKRPAKFKYDVTCDDPISDDFFIDVWQCVASSNTKIYEEVFRCYPTDNVETFEEHKMWKAQMSLAEYSPQQAEERLRDLKGTLVDFPLNFLCKATLAPKITSKEGIVSSALFT